MVDQWEEIESLEVMSLAPTLSSQIVLETSEIVGRLRALGLDWGDVSTVLGIEEDEMQEDYPDLNHLGASKYMVRAEAEEAMRESREKCAVHAEECRQKAAASARSCVEQLAERDETVAVVREEAATRQFALAEELRRQQEAGALLREELHQRAAAAEADRRCVDATLARKSRECVLLGGELAAARGEVQRLQRRLDEVLEENLEHKQQLADRVSRLVAQEEKVDVLSEEREHLAETLEALTAKAAAQEAALHRLQKDRTAERKVVERLTTKATSQEESLEVLEETSAAKQEVIDRLTAKTWSQEQDLERLEESTVAQREVLGSLTARCTAQEEELGRVRDAQRDERAAADAQIEHLTQMWVVQKQAADHLVAERAAQEERIAQLQVEKAELEQELRTGVVEKPAPKESVKSPSGSRPKLACALDERVVGILAEPEKETQVKSPSGGRPKLACAHDERVVELLCKGMEFDAAALEPASPGPWKRRPKAGKEKRVSKEKAAVLEQKTRAVLEEKMRSVLRRWHRRTAEAQPDRDRELAVENAALKAENAALKEEVAASANRIELAGEAVHWEAQRRERKLRAQLEEALRMSRAQLPTPTADQVILQHTTGVGKTQTLALLAGRLAAEGPRACEGREVVRVSEDRQLKTHIDTALWATPWKAGVYACAVRELAENGPLVLRPPGSPRSALRAPALTDALQAGLNAASCTLSGVSKCGAELQRIGGVWVLLTRGADTACGLQRGAFLVEVARRSNEVQAVLVRPGSTKLLLQFRVKA